MDLTVDDDYLVNDDHSSSIEFDELSPTIGLTWDITPDVSMYANYATSFETPTFTELASPARNLDVSLGGFNNVNAQRAKSVEVGLRGGFLDDRIYLDVAAFSMKVTDEITSVSNVGNRSFFENADTDRAGLEVYGIVDLTEDLKLSFAYTYSNFEIDSFPNNTDLNGNSLPGLPDNQLFAELEYTHQSGFYIIGDVLYVDELYANNANSVTNDSSTVANLRLGCEKSFGQWIISPFVGINNLFDEEYNSNVRINGFGGRLFEPGPERNIFGGVTLRYERR